MSINGTKSATPTWCEIAYTYRRINIFNILQPGKINTYRRKLFYYVFKKKITPYILILQLIFIVLIFGM